MFYQDYFEKLAQIHTNFHFHGSSQPHPDDHWQSHTGFVHDVLKREICTSHPNPKSIEYFLCGPPAMIKAATRMLTELGVERAQIHFDEF